MKSAEEYLCGHSELVGETLISYMQIICSKLSELLKESLIESDELLKGKSNKKIMPYTVRVHFRGYNTEKDTYEQLCVGDSTWEAYKIRSQEWGRAIRRSI